MKISEHSEIMDDCIEASQKNFLRISIEVLLKSR